MSVCVTYQPLFGKHLHVDLNSIPELAEHFGGLRTTKFRLTSHFSPVYVSLFTVAWLCNIIIGRLLDVVPIVAAIQIKKEDVSFFLFFFFFFFML